MSHRASRVWTALHALCVAALLAPLASAAGPPAEQPPEPGPPLFRPEAVEAANAARWAGSTFGVLTPRTAGFTALAVVYGGHDERVRAWELLGPLTSRDSRIATGAAGLALRGISTDGTGPLSGAAGILAGHHFNCWAVQDITRFRPLPRDWLRVVEDKSPINLGKDEATIYGRVLGLVQHTAQATLAGAARSDITPGQLVADPAFYRGEVFEGEGTLRRIIRHRPTPEAADEGVNAIYEAWVFPDTMGGQPVCFVFTDWPAGLPRSVLGKEKLDGTTKVRYAGYFFKTLGYSTKDRDQREKYAPFLIGNTLVIPARGDTPARENVAAWVKPILYAVPIVFVGLIFLVVGMTYWLRRTDATLQKRLLAARTGEWVPPPPDALPMAAPVAAVPAAKPVARAGFPQRTNLPARGGAGRGDSSPSSEGSPGGAGDKSPDEDAGG